MSAASHIVHSGALHAEFVLLADRWAPLGAWCTLWSQDGQLLCPMPQAASFWRVLWNRGQGFRNEIVHSVRQCRDQPTTTELLRINGLFLHCLPLEDHVGSAAVAALCYVADGCRWGEEFSRLCSQWHLDETLLRARFEEQPRLSETQAEHMRALIQQGLRAVFHLAAHEQEIDEMASRLADAYEELNLIYRVGATMRVTQRPLAHFTQLFEDLAEATPFTTMAAVLYDTDVLDEDSRLVLGGEPVVDASGMLKISEYVREHLRQSPNALIINCTDEHSGLAWARGWLERLLAVPIVCNKSLLGTILVLNQRGNVDFNSTDVQLLHSVADRSGVYLENLLLYGDLNKLLMGLLHALVNSIDAKDPYTCGHSNRVAVVSRRIGEQSGASPQQAERLYLGGLLHDIGKIGISELILRKPGGLNACETREMRKHPEIGARILSGIKQLDDVIPAVLHHHEWINGQGYPAGLAGEQIPWIARVVGLADAFDAMTCERKYRNALPVPAALSEIRRFAGTQFCPRLTDVLANLVQYGLADELQDLPQTPAFDKVYASWIRSEE